MDYKDLTLPIDSFKFHVENEVLNSCSFHFSHSLEEEIVLNSLIELCLNQTLSFIEQISLREFKAYLRKNPQDQLPQDELIINVLICFKKNLSSRTFKRDLTKNTLIENIKYLQALFQDYKNLYQEEIHFIDLRGYRIFLKETHLNKEKLSTYLRDLLLEFEISYLKKD